MWSVCSCPLSDRLVCSPAVLLFPSSSFSASCVLFSSCFGDWCFSLWILGVCISNLCAARCSLLAAKACSFYRRLTILTVLLIHSLPCTINCLLHLLLVSFDCTKFSIMFNMNLKRLPLVLEIITKVMRIIVVIFYCWIIIQYAGADLAIRQR